MSVRGSVGPWVRGSVGSSVTRFWAAGPIGDKVLYNWEIFCPYICPYVLPLWAIQPGLRPSQPFLSPSQPDLRPSQPASPASGMAGWASGLAGWPKEGNRRTGVQTYGQKISPFYRTWSPIGTAALPPPTKTKENVQQGKGTGQGNREPPLGYLL